MIKGFQDFEENLEIRKIIESGLDVRYLKKNFKKNIYYIYKVGNFLSIYRKDV